jgi:Phasin protein
MSTDRTVERNLSEATLAPAQFLQFGKERTDAMLNAQKELLAAYQEASRGWLARMESEIELWNALAAKLTASRTLPEGFKAYSDSISQRMKMAAEDGRHLFEDAQKLMSTLAGSLNGATPDLTRH